jgi:hypothetical protein
MESPDFGGWGGRYINVRENTWLDPVPEPTYTYPEGRWYTKTAWGRKYMREEYPENQDLMRDYFKPITRWVDALQNDFAARADWCVKSQEEANHPPIVNLTNALDIAAKPGSIIKLSAKGTTDPDGDKLSYSWWHYKEASSLEEKIVIENANYSNALIKVPYVDKEGSIHIICEVKDNGSPQLTRYKRVIINVEP